MDTIIASLDDIKNGVGPYGNTYQVLIQTPAGIIKSIYNGITINGMNTQFKNLGLVESSLKTINKTLSSKLPNLLKIGGNALDIAKNAVGIGSFVADTIQTWSGNNNPSISLDVYFVQTQEGDSNYVMNDYAKLVNGIFPNKLGFSHGVDKGLIQNVDLSVFTAPYGYTPLNLFSKVGEKNISYQNNASATTTITIGNWFNAGGLLLTSANPTISEELNSEGKPIYIKVTCNYKPYKGLSAKEFLEWFPGVTAPVKDYLNNGSFNFLNDVYNQIKNVFSFSGDNSVVKRTPSKETTSDITGRQNENEN